MKQQMATYRHNDLKMIDKAVNKQLKGATMFIAHMQVTSHSYHLMGVNEEQVQYTVFIVYEAYPVELVDDSK